jgi:methionyl-tRNA formyltransferase
MVETLQGLQSGSVHRQPQDHSQATLAPVLKKEDGLAEFAFPAPRIYNRLRGFQPWPGCYTFFRGKKLAITAASPTSSDSRQDSGTLKIDGSRLFVACGEKTALELLEVQPEGKRRISAGDFLRGYRPEAGEKLGS